ncbi:MAG: DUF4230 domain-containing protein [Prevotella sp.]|nr:DUF4230 domain-containing protein [Prevotella sp.]MBR6140131.1 DUF4230 domain-containing protein [Prevotella sp.]
MKKLLIVVITATMLSACGNSVQDSQKSQLTQDSIPKLIMQVQKSAKLYTAEIQVHKIITHDDDLKIKGSILQQDFDIPLPLGSRKVAIPMDATVKAYIDFANFSEKNVKREGEKIEIILPDPQVELTSTRINHDDVKKHVPLFRSNFSDKELADYSLQGRKAIVNDIPKMGVVKMAQESATRMLVPMLQQMGYEESNITITFRKDFSEKDVLSIIKVNIEGK